LAEEVPTNAFQGQVDAVAYGPIHSPGLIDRVHAVQLVLGEDEETANRAGQLQEVLFLFRR